MKRHITVEVHTRRLVAVEVEHPWPWRWFRPARQRFAVLVAGRDWRWDDTGALVDGNSAERTPIEHAIRIAVMEFERAQQHLDIIERLPTSRWHLQQDDQRLN